MKLFGAAFIFSTLFVSNSIATPVLAGSMETMDIGGYKTEFVQEGSGRPVIFVHGAASDLAVWEAFPPLLSDEFNVIAYNQRYFGSQDWPDDGSGFSVTTLFDDLIAFVEGLDQGPVDLVTWSSGGQIGLGATMKRPDLFRSAIHYEPFSTLDMSGVDGYEAAGEELNSKFGPVFEALGGGKEVDGVFLFIEAVLNLQPGEAETYPEPLVDMWKRNARTIIPNFSADDAPVITCAELGAVMTPTLVLVGGETYKDFSMLGSEHAKCLGNATLKTMQGVNHGGPLADPDVFANVIMDFLSAN